jgi:hypothetical protein
MPLWRKKNYKPFLVMPLWCWCYEVTLLSYQSVVFLCQLINLQQCHVNIIGTHKNDRNLSWSLNFRTILVNTVVTDEGNLSKFSLVGENIILYRLLQVTQCLLTIREPPKIMSFCYHSALQSYIFKYAGYATFYYLTTKEI